MIPPWLLAVTAPPPNPRTCPTCKGKGTVRAWVWELVQVTKQRVKGKLDSKTAFKRSKCDQMCGTCMGRKVLS